MVEGENYHGFYYPVIDKERCIKEEVVAKKLQELQKEKDIEEDRKKSLELTVSPS